MKIINDFSQKEIKLLENIKVNIERVSKYTKEFDDDFYIITVLMHGVVWNSPQRINTHRKNIGEKLLTDEEYEKYKRIRKENEERFENYMEFLREKYGQDLDAVSNYYSLREA